MQSFIFTEKIRYFGYSQSQRVYFILSVTHIRSYQDLVLLPEDCGVLVVVDGGGGGGTLQGDQAEQWRESIRTELSTVGRS